MLQLTIGDTVVTEKGITDKKRFYLPKNLIDKFDGHTLWFNITEDEAYNTYSDIEEILQIKSTKDRYKHSQRRWLYLKNS